VLFDATAGNADEDAELSSDRKDDDEALLVIFAVASDHGFPLASVAIF
jgi:hypothetical protein